MSNVDTNSDTTPFYQNHMVYTLHKPIKWTEHLRSSDRDCIKDTELPQILITINNLTG